MAMMCRKFRNSRLFASVVSEFYVEFIYFLLFEKKKPKQNSYNNQGSW